MFSGKGKTTSGQHEKDTRPGRYDNLPKHLMDIDRQEVGKRLLAYRSELEMTQTFVCQKTGLAQNTLSILESGRGGGFDSFLILLKFYSKEFNIHNIFAKKFMALSKNNNETIENVTAKIAISEIDQLQEIIMDRFTIIKEAFKE